MAGPVIRQLVVVVLALAILASGQSHARAGVSMLNWHFSSVDFLIATNDGLLQFIDNNDVVCPACPACPEERTADAPCAYISCNLAAALSLLPLVDPLRVDNEKYLMRPRAWRGIDGTLDPPPPRRS